MSSPQVQPIPPPSDEFWSLQSLKAYIDTVTAGLVNTSRAELVGQRDTFAQQHNDLRDMLQERYETQTKATDKAFEAQQTAMQAALTAAERAVATALLSAEKAVAKAEVAADKRFESVNEFRAQLADQAATMMTRIEAEARIGALAERLDASLQRNAERITNTEHRLDQAQGQERGGDRHEVDTRARLAQFIASAAVLVAMIAIVVTIILAFKH